MRRMVHPERLAQLMRRFAQEVQGPGKVYVTGGASMLLWGIRQQTIDVDLKLDPEPRGAFEAIASLKDELDLNIELASPDDFIPVPSDWREHSPLVQAVGSISFHHFDPRAQVLAKLERGLQQDLEDSAELLRRGLVSAQALRDAFARVRDSIIRYPAVDAAEFERKVQRFLSEHETGR